MKALVTQRVQRLAESLEELKVKVRTALAAEMANVIGTAVRDILVVALINRILTTPPRSDHWREDTSEDRDPWDDPVDTFDRMPARCEHCDRSETEPASAGSTTAATSIAVGVNVGRWWLTRTGTIPAAIGLGVAVTVLGLAGGPIARAIFAVLAATTDVLTAESALARLDPS